MPGRLPLRALRRVGLRQQTCRRTFTTTTARADEKFNVMDKLAQRGFVSAVTNPSVHEHLNASRTIYSGVDPTASSLHVGNLLPLMALLHFYLEGHQVIALIGGATGSIGDPSGRSTERTALEPHVLDANVKAITGQVEQFFKNGAEYARQSEHKATRSAPDEKAPVKVVNNLDWHGGIGFLQFLREVGKLARMSTMLSRDAVKSRLNSDSGISFTEFSYQLLQAYDFLTLYRQHDCRIQLGGSDQWGNIVAGIDLIKKQKLLDLEAAAAEEAEREKNRPRRPYAERRAEAEAKHHEAFYKHKMREAGIEPPKPQVPETLEQRAERESHAYGITLPLLTTSGGEKFGKSAGNAVWLDPNQTSPSRFYQFFFRVDDEKVETYLKLFTLLPYAKIREIMQTHLRKASERVAQKVLAEQVTTLVHGSRALDNSLRIADMIYKTPPRELKSQEVLEAMQYESNFSRMKWKDVKGVVVGKMMVVLGLCTSRAHSSRSINAKLVWVSGRRIDDQKSEISRSDVIDKHLIVIKSSKKTAHVIYVDFEETTKAKPKSEPEQEQQEEPEVVEQLEQEPPKPEQLEQEQEQPKSEQERSRPEQAP